METGYLPGPVVTAQGSTVLNWKWVDLDLAYLDIFCNAQEYVAQRRCGDHHWKSLRASLKKFCAAWSSEI